MTVPHDGRRSSTWTSRATQVREAQGEWVLVARNAWPNTASRLRRGMYAAFRPADDFEVVTRRPEQPEPGQSPHKIDVWVRLAEGGDA